MSNADQVNREQTAGSCITSSITKLILYFSVNVNNKIDILINDCTDYHGDTESQSNFDNDNDIDVSILVSILASVPKS